MIKIDNLDYIWPIVIEFAIIFVIKIIDNFVGTGKQILIQKNKKILASILVGLSQIIFYKLIDAVSSSDNKGVLIVIAVAAGLGTYFAMLVNDKFSKDRTYVNVILSDDRAEMSLLRDFLMENKITNVATDAYTKDWNTTIAITAYTETKYQSKLIDDYIKNQDTKFKRLITKQ